MSTRPVERISLAGVVGVRLRDELTGATVGDGLTVKLVAPGGTTTTIRTPSGVFAAHGVRGLRDHELPDGGPPVPVRARIEVRDGLRRFHAFRVDVALSAGEVLVNPCRAPGLPPTFDDRSLPLFSLPSRLPGPGRAVVRARLLYEDTRLPAAYAALEVVPLAGAEPVRGIADERGEVMVAFAYPPPPGPSGSPPSGTRRKLTRAAWTVGVQVLVPQVSPPPVPPGQLPNLCDFLDQVPATLVTTASPPVELREATIEYGRELVLRSSPDEPALLVRP